MMVCALVVMLPLMMGHRTPATLTVSQALLVCTAVLAMMVPILLRQLALPSGGWLWVFALMSGMVLLQVWPSNMLARAFGPFPAELWAHPYFEPRHWSPDPGATLRGWAVFVALFCVAWLGRSLPGMLRHWVWLAIVIMALFQALYGLLAHASGAESILGIWERRGTDWVHGSFSNRNLYAAYLALTWPLAVGVWWFRGMPGLGRLPTELKVTGSVLCGSIMGAAMLGSGSRLGAAAGVFGMLLALMLWGRHRRLIHGASAWPAYLAALGALVAALWYGFTPLAERLIATTGEEMRLEVFAVVLSEFPRQWFVHGIGLGGFEAAFRPFQPSHISGWFDYAHNDVLQWLVETGVVGLAVLGIVVAAMVRKARLTTERIALYAGLAALCVVAVGDFSWHIPGTQVVLAFYIGALVR